MSTTTVSCGCGYESARIACARARSEIRDAHAKRCDFAPMLPYQCATCGDWPQHCPAMSHTGGFIRTDAVLAAGCWTPEADY